MRRRTVVRQRRSLALGKKADESEVVKPKVSARIKRVRIGGGRIGVKPTEINADDEKRMNLLLKSISTAQLEISELGRTRDIQVEELFRSMKMYRVNSWRVKQGDAEIVRSKGRASNTIDAVEFRKLVTDEDFWESVKINATDAAKVLPAKHLKEITTTVPGKLGPESLQCTIAKSK